jgi:hypothetical protein
VRFRHIDRSGTYLRVADPAWPDPLDGSWAAATGGRWNPPDSFPVVYLFSHVDVARSFTIAKHHGLPYSVTDLLPARQPDLVYARVAEASFVDVITDAGCSAAGLPKTYPRDHARRQVGWNRCRPAGEAARNQGESGIACRSATARRGDTGEELAWFQRRRRLRSHTVQSFLDWFPPAANEGRR